MKTLFLALPPLCSALLLCACAALFSACYTLKQGAAMLSLLRSAVPLEELGAAGSEEDARFAERVRDIRAFAINELGLKDTKNYTRYVNIDRSYLAAVVSACEADAFNAHTWWFPVVGRLPYKGFFNAEDAKKEAERLRKKGLDVWVRGVDAFSTLGYFRDPLYSYMRDYSVYNLADLLIHELFHATVFIKNDARFNEQAAEFTGRTGARLYIESRFGRDAELLKAEDARRADSAAFVARIQALEAELDALYKSAAPRQDTLAQKAALIKAAQERFAAEYDAVFQSGAYRYFAELPANNAYIQLYQLYHEEDRYLEELYQKTGSDLRAFIAAAKRVKSAKKAKEQLEAALIRQ